MVKAPIIQVSLLCTVLALSSCQPPTPQDEPAKPQTEQVSASEEKATQSATNTMPQDPSGPWSTTDDQGRPFDIVLYPNNQAVSTWTYGPAGAKGERGLWRKQGSEIIIFFSDGWTDIMDFSGETPTHRGYEPGRPLSQPPTNQAAIKPAEGPGREFVGVWRLNKEPDGNYLYLTLLSDGRALSTINGGTEGKWEMVDGAAKCTWPDGWIDVIERVEGSWRKKSWVGSTDTDTSQVDISAAAKIGEISFVVTP